VGQRAISSRKSRQVYDSNHGQPDPYNQGTFITLCYNIGLNRGRNEGVQLSHDHGCTISPGITSCPQYSINENNSPSMASVPLGVSYLKSMVMQSTYLGWLQTNAQHA